MDKNIPTKIKKIITAHKNICITALFFLALLCIFIFIERSRLSKVTREIIFVSNLLDETLHANQNLSDQIVALQLKNEQITETNRQYAEQLENEITRRKDAALDAHDMAREMITQHSFEAPLITVEGMPIEKLHFIIRHFDAMFSADMETYIETTTNPYDDVFNDEESGGFTQWKEWLMSFIAEEPYYRAEVKFIGGVSGHIPVYVLTQLYPDSEPELQIFYTGVGVMEDVFWIYDYD